jgi:hypothetical protein
MVEIRKKVTKIGDGYGILIPKALIECKVFNPGEYLKVTIEKQNHQPGLFGVPISEIQDKGWKAFSPLEKTDEAKPLKKTALEPRRAMVQCSA